MNQGSTDILFMINEGPYGDERSYKALRLALNIARQPQTEVKLFLVGDSVTCGNRGQGTPDGY